MKKILYIILGIFFLIILAGIFKFNILSNIEGYDVDGNPIKDDDILGEIIGTPEKEKNNQKLEEGNADLSPENIKDIVLEIPEADRLENKKELEERLKRLKIKIMKTETVDGRKIDETVFVNGEIEPIKNINPEYRPDFRYVLEKPLKAKKIKITKENLLKNFPSLRETDFENTGKLLYQADFDILLNNFLKRVGIEPATDEDFSVFLEDFEKGVFDKE